MYMSIQARRGEAIAQLYIIRDSWDSDSHVEMVTTSCCVVNEDEMEVLHVWRHTEEQNLALIADEVEF